jgi:hypothetical protein
MAIYSRHAGKRYGPERRRRETLEINRIAVR